MDLNAGKIMLGENTIDDIGAGIFQMVLDVSNGKFNRCKINKHYEFSIPRIGSTL